MKKKPRTILIRRLYMNETIDFSIVDEIIRDHGHRPSAIISILQGIQEHYHYLPGPFFPYLAKSLHGISWIYDTAVPNLVKSAGTALHRFDNGSLPRYLSLAVGGVAVISIIFLLVLLGMF